ncbi:hypothetical protein MKL09_04315 [Methylobacterium sp. J-048]|uniref:hypothetical protein n=1 Tax=Methylobacterium sp. J-048 TaxID=2836635 RepID=UPI001FBBC09E|nr:hypothetical protein [Methylobacterium sp. J-048]MCJ2055771.1 hypothetical protein [Methylobacterium sp. J-048]
MDATGLTLPVELVVLVELTGGLACAAGTVELAVEAATEGFALTAVEGVPTVVLLVGVLVEPMGALA